MSSKIANEVWQSLFATTDLMHYLRMRSEPLFKKSVSFPQLKLLGCLFRHHGEGMRLKDIAFEMDITPGGMSQAVDVLVKNGLVERFSSDVDRRAVSIRLSQEGKAIRKKLTDFYSQMAENLIEGIPADDLVAFCRVNTLFQEKLKKKKQLLLTQLKDKNSEK